MILELESRPLEWRSAGNGLCSYRVRGVYGSCAKHLTVESYTVVMLQTVTHTHPFNGRLSGTTQVSQYQKGKNQSGFY